MAGDGGLVGRLEDHVVPVAGTAPGTGMEDLRPLADVFADRRVVGLGEATHGTREFFQLKHRLVRFLVTELDFRLFGLEANFSETLAIDDYVVSGDGDPEAALDGIYFWTWNTEEVLALIEWLRRYNEGRPATEKVRFYGFDCQYARGPARALGTFFERVDPDYLEGIEEGMELLESGRVGDDPDELATAATVAADLKTRLADRADAYRSATSDRELRLMRRHCRIVEQACEFAAAQAFEDAGTPNGVRDAFMAENVSWILDHEDASRIALWAHNGHVMKGRFDDGDRETPPKRMGNHLEREFGDGYYALGFEFGRGSFRAYPDPQADESGLGAFSLDSIPEDSAPALLDRVDGPTYVLDFESAERDPAVREWLARERPLHRIGAVYYDDSDRTYTPVALATELDGLAYVAETTRAVPVGDGQDSGRRSK